MSLLQAFEHFVVEAARNLVRSWKVSLLAIVVTAVSLVLGGALFLLGSNLARALGAWEEQARLVVYMEPGAPVEETVTVESRIRQFDGVTSWRFVSPEDAERELRHRLPELDELLDGLEDAPLPGSFEIALQRDRSIEETRQAWIDELESLPGVDGVDDDTRWMKQIAFAAALLRAGAAIVGGVLLAGSVFIIASVIRLAALVHREEIRVLRLVGATEFFVRGPFVVEGIIQGFLGSIVALIVLFASYSLLERHDIPELVRQLMLPSFLGPGAIVALVAIGTGAGLVGGMLSVRRTAAGLW